MNFSFMKDWIVSKLKKKNGNWMVIAWQLYLLWMAENGKKIQNELSKVQAMYALVSDTLFDKSVE